MGTKEVKKQDLTPSCDLVGCSMAYGSVLDTLGGSNLESVKAEAR